MKASLLLTCLASLLTAPTVMAQSGINLNWGECFNAGGYADLAAACDSDVGPPYGPLIGSVKPAQAVPQFVGMEAVIDLQTEAEPLPDWWTMNAAGCRPTALSMAFDFTATGPFGCITGPNGEGDPFRVGAEGGVFYESGFGGVDRARIVVTVALLDQPGPPLDPADAEEWYLFKLNISRLHSIDGQCPGCATSVCIVLTSVLLAQPAGVGDFLYSSPAERHHVTWNGWGPPPGNRDCPAATPARSSTWGQIKSQYR